MYIEISNKGEIDVNALTLMGATTKDGINSIGMFGTGNKYALAFMMRNKYNLKIFSGMNEITVTTKRHTFRDKDFDVLYINGDKTSITTDTGKINWYLWMAIRELYSNAMDEGEARLTNAERIVPEKDRTKIYIEANSADIHAFIANIREYFPSSGSILYENELGRVYRPYKPNKSTHFYRKGILMYEHSRPCIYNYDIFNVRLNENRCPLYSWEMDEKLWKFIFSIKDRNIIKNILSASKNAKNPSEGEVLSVSDIPEANSDIVKEVADELNIVPEEFAGMLDDSDLRGSTPVPKKIYIAIKGKLDFDNMKWLDAVGSFIIVETSPMQKHMIKKAVDFLEEVKFEIHGEIHVAKFQKSHLLGACEKNDKMIYISENAFENGMQCVVETIIEESCHNESGLGDTTRGFQDFLIKKLVNVYKEYNSYIL